MNNESIDSIDTEPSWGKLSISYWLALLVGLALIGLGVNGLIQPSVAAEAFGLPLSSSLDSGYVRVKAGRDLIVDAAAIIFVFLKMKKPFSIFCYVGAGMPLIDGILVLTQHGGQWIYSLQHFITALFILFVAYLVGRTP